MGGGGWGRGGAESPHSPPNQVFVKIFIRMNVPIRDYTVYGTLHANLYASCINIDI